MGQIDTLKSTERSGPDTRRSRNYQRARSARSRAIESLELNNNGTIKLISFQGVSIHLSIESIIKSLVKGDTSFDLSNDVSRYFENFSADLLKR